MYKRQVRNSTPDKPDTLSRIQQAMRNHVLEEETIIYPKRPNHKKHYSNNDWRIQQNLQNLRHLMINIRMETLSENNYEDHSNCVDNTKNKIKYDKADPVKKSRVPKNVEQTQNKESIPMSGEPGSMGRITGRIEMKEPRKSR